MQYGPWGELRNETDAQAFLWRSSVEIAKVCNPVLSRVTGDDGGDEWLRRRVTGIQRRRCRKLRLRTTITAHRITGYELGGRVTSDGTQYIGISRWDGPLNDFASLNNVPGPGLRNGDVMCATAIGSTLTLYVNNVQIVQVANTKYAEGSPGMGFYNQGGTLASNSDYGFADFCALNAIGTSYHPNKPRIFCTHLQTNFPPLVGFAHGEK